MSLDRDFAQPAYALTGLPRVDGDRATVQQNPDDTSAVARFMSEMYVIDGYAYATLAEATMHAARPSPAGASS